MTNNNSLAVSQPTPKIEKKMWFLEKIAENASVWHYYIGTIGKKPNSRILCGKNFETSQMSRYMNCIRMLCAAHTHTKLSRSRGQHVINTEFMTWAQYWKTRRKNHQKPNAKIWFSAKNFGFRGQKRKQSVMKSAFFTLSFSYLILYFSSSRFAFWSNSRYLIFAWADSRSRSKSRLFRWRSSISAFQGYFRSKNLWWISSVLPLKCES